MMGDEFAECVRLAKENNDMHFVIKANELKRKSDKTKVDTPSLEKAIVKLQNKKLKLTN